MVLILVDCSLLMRSTPLVLREAIENSRTRIPFEQAYARALEQLPPQGEILVWTSDHIGAFERAGIPLRRTINESDYYQWKPALEHPAQSAAFVITCRSRCRGAGRRGASARAHAAQHCVLH